MSEYGRVLFVETKIEPTNLTTYKTVISKESITILNK